MGEALADLPAETAPRDGRVIRGWFEFDGVAQMIAVCWDPEHATWVNLIGEPVPKSATLKNWGGD